jgi:hypothetical protein
MSTRKISVIESATWKTEKIVSTLTDYRSRVGQLAGAQVHLGVADLAVLGLLARLELGDAVGRLAALALAPAAP